MGKRNKAIPIKRTMNYVENSKDAYQTRIKKKI
jgi:hypothetical protein